MNREWKIFAAFLGVFLFAYFVPLATPQFDAQADPLAAKITGAIVEAFLLLQWYARNHTLACVVPALFIAGAITTFLSKESVLKHLGPKANKVESYSVASVSGTVLAVCSCSVLPMFAGIYRIGAGLGPAACFLYAGPAINVLAIFLTARVLGFELGVARVIGAMVFGVIIGLIMAVLFRRSEDERSEVTMAQPDPPAASRPLWKNASMLAAMLAFLVFSDWFNPGDKVVQMADGQQFEATLQYETENSFDLRLKQAALRPRSVRSRPAGQDRHREHRGRRYLGDPHPSLPLVLGGSDGRAGRGDEPRVAQSPRLRRVDGQYLGVFQIARAPAVWRRLRRRFPGRPHSGEAGGGSGGRQQPHVEPDRFGRRLPVLLRHADRGSRSLKR